MLKPSLFASISLVVCLVQPGPAAWAADLKNGRILAEKHCAICHVVGDFNKFGGIDSTPSFQLLASLRDGAERFQSFYARRPHPSFVFLPDQKPPSNMPLNAPAVHLTYEQVDDIVFFARTLKDPKLVEPKR